MFQIKWNSSFGELAPIPSRLYLIYTSVGLFHLQSITSIMKGRNLFFMPYGLVVLVRFGVLVLLLYLLNFPGPVCFVTYLIWYFVPHWILKSLQWLAGLSGIARIKCRMVRRFGCWVRFLVRPLMGQSLRI